MKLFILGKVNSNIFNDYRPNYARPSCWINSQQGFVLFFGLPLGSLFLENIVFATLGLICIIQHHRGASGGLKGLTSKITFQRAKTSKFPVSALANSGSSSDNKYDSL